VHDDDSNGSDGAPTRREYITYGGAVVGGGLLAGCTGTGGSGSGGAPDPTATDPTATEPSTETETSAETEASADSDTDTEEPESTETDGSYEVCIEPVGCVAFEEVPETYVVYNGAWADMAFALGRRDGFLTGGNMIPGFLFEPFGLTVPPEGELPVMWDGGWDKELFYELDPDVILADPNLFESWDDSWDESDTEAFREQYVTPMEEDSVGGQLTAVRNGTVYPGQYGEQGPLTNLLQTEMVAQQLYPGEFGAFAPEEFPTVPEDRRLFDRQRVRDIIKGDV